MVRGGGQFRVSLCRTLGRQCEKIRNNVIVSNGSDMALAAASSHASSSAPSPASQPSQASRSLFPSSCGSSGAPEGWSRAGNCGHFSTLADTTDVGSKSSDNEVSFGTLPAAPGIGYNFPVSQFEGASDPKGGNNDSFFATDASKSSFESPVGGDEPLPPEKGIYFPASTQFPGRVPEPKLKNDRYFRARNNSTVANMLKLLEAAPTKNDVEQILDNHISEFSESSRWPWLPLLDALQRGPKPYLALEVFNWKIDKVGGDSKEYAKMISTAGKLNQLDLATSMFREMEEKGVKRSPITCNALMSAYSKNDQAGQALAIFREMRDAEDCKPTLVTYNTLISMYSKLSVPDMEKYFDLCKASGFYPDRVTFNSMIWGYMRAGQFDKMEEMYEQLQDSGCKADPITFSGLIIGFSKANALDKMDLAFTHMQEEGFPITTMVAEILVEFYSLEKKFEKMERIMKIVNNTPGASCSSRIYGFAIQSYAEAGRISEMEETMEKMYASERLFTSARTLESVITAYGERANFKSLDMIVQKVKSMGWGFQHSTFHCLLYQYGKGRQFEQMEQIFNEMKAAPDVQPTEDTFKILSDSYHSAGDAEGLKWTVDRMSAVGFSTKEVVNKQVDCAWTDDEIFGGRRR